MARPDQVELELVPAAFERSDDGGSAAGALRALRAPGPKRWQACAGLSALVLAVTLLLYAAASSSGSGGAGAVAVPCGCGCSRAVPSLQPGGLLPSPSDRRAFRRVVLPNGVEALVASDNTTKECAAAVAVGVGSKADPREHPGLAHFLEHMLFMGSEKYPDEADYSAFVAAHGGYDNAYTSEEVTNYFFTAEADALRPVLDRLAQFFVAPLLTESAVQREVHAVDAEHRKNLQSDGWRLWQLEKHLANPESPWNHFSTGSLETLDTPDVYTALRAFFDAYYGAPNLRVTVLGRESLDELEDMVRELFSEVPRRGGSALGARGHGPLPYAGPYGGRWVEARTIGSDRTLELMWTVETVRGRAWSMLGGLLEHAFSSRHEGSLHQELKRRNWASDVYVGLEDTDGFALVTLGVQLTAAGQGNASAVALLAHEAVGGMRYHEAHLCGVWEEVVALATLTFRFQEQSDPEDWASGVARALRFGDPAEALGSPERATYLPGLISEVLDAMADPAGLIVTLSAPDVDGNLSEPVYGTEYSDRELDEAEIVVWRTAATPPGPSWFELPPANPYVPTAADLELQPVRDTQAEAPRLALDEKALAVYEFQDATFRIPRVVLRCEIGSPAVVAAVGDVEAGARLDMRLALAADAAEQQDALAARAGLVAGVSRTTRGLALQAEGYSLRAALELLEDKVVSAAAPPHPPAGRFDALKEGTLASWDSWLPGMYLYQSIRSYVQRLAQYEPAHTVEENVAAVRGITLEEALGPAGLLDGASAACLVLGNVHDGSADEVAASLRRAVDRAGGSWGDSTLAQPASRVGVVAPLPGTDVVFRRGPLVESDTENSALVDTWTMPVPRDEAEAFMQGAVAGVLSEVLQPVAFDTLRTREALGYVATLYHRIHPRHADGVRQQTIHVLVQSGVYGCDVMYDRVTEFLAREALEAVVGLRANGTFDEAVAAYVEKLEEPALSLGEQADRWDGELAWVLSGSSPRWDRSETQAAAARNLTLPQLEAAYNATLLSPSSVRLSVQVDAKSAPAVRAAGAPVVDAADAAALRAWKARQPVW